ncbi:MAG: hypothetical protein J6S67_23550 [Methanobrevibacter sp.]|nr:hypothetical protein [Methanobrevibacter sp.]
MSQYNSNYTGRQVDAAASAATQLLTQRPQTPQDEGVATALFINDEKLYYFDAGGGGPHLITGRNYQAGTGIEIDNNEISMSGFFPYSTVAPTAPNLDGTLRVVVLNEEPQNRYRGYLYLIAQSSPTPPSPAIVGIAQIGLSRLGSNPVPPAIVGSAQVGFSQIEN